MNKAIENITETIKENWKDISEIFKERVFSPMYFYFIIAWVITNWEFVYSILFLKQDFLYKSESLLKIEYLESFYSFNLWSPMIISIFKLFLIPAVSSFVFVWWLSKISESFYEKTEEHKQNKRVINKWIEFQEDKKIKLKLYYINQKLEKEKKEISKDISISSIDYQDNQEFNDWFDEINDIVKIWDIEYLASESLFNNDPEAYKEKLKSWKDENLKDEMKEKLKDEIIEEYINETSADFEFQQMRER